MEHSNHLLGFIVGMSRAGTTWMSRCIGKHPDVITFGETSFWGRKYIQPTEKGYYTKKQLTGILNGLKKTGITSHRVGFLNNVSSGNISYLIDREFSKVREPMSPADVFIKICIFKARQQWCLK